MRFIGSLIFIHSSCLPVSCAIDIEISSSVINIPPTVKLISQAFAGRKSHGDRWALTQLHIRIVLGMYRSTKSKSKQSFVMRVFALRNRRITRCMRIDRGSEIGLEILCLRWNSRSFRGNVRIRNSPNPSYDVPLPHTCENSFLYDAYLSFLHAYRIRDEVCEKENCSIPQMKFQWYL